MLSVTAQFEAIQSPEAECKQSHYLVNMQL